jgi:hypothetical protein
MTNEREPWEHELTRVIHIARLAELPEVVSAIQNAIGQIYLLKDKANDLQQIKQLLGTLGTLCTGGKR